MDIFQIELSSDCAVYHVPLNMHDPLVLCTIFSLSSNRITVQYVYRRRKTGAALASFWSAPSDAVVLQHTVDGRPYIGGRGGSGLTLMAYAGLNTLFFDFAYDEDAGVEEAFYTICEAA